MSMYLEKRINDLHSKIDKIIKLHQEQARLHSNAVNTLKVIDANMRGLMEYEYTVLASPNEKYTPASLIREALKDYE